LENHSIEYDILKKKNYKKPKDFRVAREGITKFYFEEKKCFPFLKIYMSMENSFPM
jgi:hypothetical protein